MNFKATGLCEKFGSWWYVANGRVDFKANRKVSYGGKQYNVVNGKVVF